MQPPQQHDSFSPTTHSQQTASAAVDRLLRQAEISRLTRNLKSKLALASMKTQKSPLTSPVAEARRRSKTLEGAVTSSRRIDTPLSRQRTSSRRSSVTSVSSASSYGSSPTLASPRARIPRISSVSSIYERNNEDEGRLKHSVSRHSPNTPLNRYSPDATKKEALEIPKIYTTEEEPLPKEPQTPPSIKRPFPKTPERGSSSDGANLLLHFAHSPGRATPRTPDFNMSDYLHFQTPSPARGQLTPRHTRWGSLNSALFQPPMPATVPRPADSNVHDDSPA